MEVVVGSEISSENAENQSVIGDVFDHITSIKEIDCYIKYSNETYIHSIAESRSQCPATWDGVSCWPTTQAGHVSYVPCFAELNGVLYDTNSNASRLCQENGTWSTWSNYRSCKALKLHDDEFMQVLWDMREAATIYYVGYSISLVALSIALFIFFYFKDLGCLRNTIHTNLMVTYLLIDVTWILTATLQSNPNPSMAKVACCLVILLTYLMGTNFLWMLVEGLYLYMQVVRTFSLKSIHIRTYMMIGWGIPAIIALSWAIAKYLAGGVADEPLAQRGCPWQNKDNYDYVFSCPVMLVLLINIFFLTKIMWVLITKLRASNSVESKQYRKATKALFVLIPLLGVTYIMVIATPSDPVAEVVFMYLQATLLSMQGCVVAVLYCFLNGEVQNSMRHHLERWKTHQSISRSRNTTSTRRSLSLRLSLSRSTRHAAQSRVNTLVRISADSPNLNSVRESYQPRAQNML